MISTTPPASATIDARPRVQFRPFNLSYPLAQRQALAQRRWDFALIQESYERYHWEHGELEYPNLPEPVHTGLRLRAARKGHSMEAEARTFLRRRYEEKPDRTLIRSCCRISSRECSKANHRSSRMS